MPGANRPKGSEVRAPRGRAHFDSGPVAQVSQAS